MSRKILMYFVLGGLAGLLVVAAGRAVADIRAADRAYEDEDGPALVEDPLSIERVEWDDPCGQLYKDIENQVDPEDITDRYGVPANLTVPGAGEIAGLSCMAGSDTGLEAVVVHRRDGDVVYSDYIIADGGAAIDWPEWFAVTQPDTEIRPINHGWTTEPPGVSDGLPNQPVWEPLADVLREVER